MDAKIIEDLVGDVLSLLPEIDPAEPEHLNIVDHAHKATYLAEKLSVKKNEYFMDGVWSAMIILNAHGALTAARDLAVSAGGIDEMQKAAKRGGTQQDQDVIEWLSTEF